MSRLQSINFNLKNWYYAQPKLRDSQLPMAVVWPIWGAMNAAQGYPKIGIALIAVALPAVTAVAKPKWHRPIKAIYHNGLFLPLGITVSSGIKVLFRTIAALETGSACLAAGFASAQLAYETGASFAQASSFLHTATCLTGMFAAEALASIAGKQTLCFVTNKNLGLRSLRGDVKEISVNFVTLLNEVQSFRQEQLGKTNPQLNYEAPPSLPRKLVSKSTHTLSKIS